MRLARWAIVAAVLTGAAVRPAAAQPGPLAPVGGPPEPRPALAFDPGPVADTSPVSGSPAPSRRSDDYPTNVLGPPVLGAPVRPVDRDPPKPTTRTSDSLVPAAATEPPADRGRRVSLGAPVTAGKPLAAGDVETRSRDTSYVAAGDRDDPVNELLSQRSGERVRERRTADRGEVEHASAKFGDRIGEFFGNKGDWFRSDHAFDGFISPVTNPFLFEDPRSVTELRPIFLFQKIPSNQPDFQGGNVWYFGTQARLAVTDRLSFTINKLGGLSFNPNQTPDDTGFAELWLGPKYTILRGEDTGRLLTAGLQFQIPIGSKGIYQDTGTLSLAPWLTFAQNFGREWRVGSMNALVNTGYSFGTDKVRSDYWWLSAHLDLDVLNNHRFYPLVEMNWFLYTADGNASSMTSEGRDLFNFGSQAGGTGQLTIAVGARFKLTESAQIGGAFEFPLAGPKGIFDYRASIDFILRY